MILDGAFVELQICSQLTVLRHFIKVKYFSHFHVIGAIISVVVGIEGIIMRAHLKNMFKVINIDIQWGGAAVNVKLKFTPINSEISTILQTIHRPILRREVRTSDWSATIQLHQSVACRRA